jgi:hypothetical protein
LEVEMARHHKRHVSRKGSAEEKRYQFSTRLDVNPVGDKDDLQITWRRDDGEFDGMIIPQKAAPILIKRLVGWLDVD